MTTTALATRQQLNPIIWETIMAVAPIMKDSRLFGVATEAQAAAIMAKGFELGLTLTASFEFIAVIENKPTLSPRGALALILNSPELAGLDIKDEVDDKGVPAACVVTMKRRNGFSYTARFSMDDARRAGLVKAGSGWEKYPANMLRARASGYCADVVFPDVLGGLKRADELGAEIDAAGNVVDGQWSAVPTPTMTVLQPAAAAPAPITLQQLVDQFGAEAIMATNNGQIPATQNELDDVALALGAV
jgi:hypothetical protein